MWTDAEERRIRAIETILNNAQTAISNVISKEQVRQLLLIKQRQIDALTARVNSLETQVANLQSEL